jgi:hypothetical protein
MQWHPIFAHLLRPLLQDYYDVLTDLPVGDLPRQADIVLIHRTAAGPAPLQGIWRHLSAWNVLEFKGPSDAPALRDLDLLWEIGLGIERRLNEERSRQAQPAWERDAVAWWYLANHVGQRLRAEAERLLGQPLQEREDGVWEGVALGRSFWLVSRDRLPVEAANMPLQLVTREASERQRAMIQLVARDPVLWKVYGAWLLALHPHLKEEVQAMAGQQLENEAVLDFRPVIELIGLKQVIDQVGLKQVIDQVGLKQVIDQVGLKQVMEQVGAERVLAEMGLEWFLSQLTPEQLHELKQRLP